MGNRRQQLKNAEILIGKRIGKIKKVSSLYQTASWGKTDQPDFLNQVLLVETTLSAQQVLDNILETEIELGRIRGEKWGSRLIDIDILFYNDEIINTDLLTVPHPYLHERRFTLEPLNEIASELKHPILNQTIRELLVNLRDDLNVNRIQ